MIFLLVNNCRSSLIHNLFLLFYRKKTVLLISMTEAEENSGDWASLREFIECLVLQELFNISLVLNFWRVIACETSSQMCIDERRLELIHTLVRILVFIFFVGILIEILLSIYRC